MEECFTFNLASLKFFEIYFQKFLWGGGGRKKPLKVKGGTNYLSPSGKVKKMSDRESRRSSVRSRSKSSVRVHLGKVGNLKANNSLDRLSVSTVPPKMYILSLYTTAVWKSRAVMHWELGRGFTFSHDLWSRSKQMRSVAKLSVAEDTEPPNTYKR